MILSNLPGWFRQFDVYNILNQWENAGVFDYLLPFLLVFAVVFGILQTSKVLGEQRGIHAIVALVIGMFTMRYFQIGEFIGVIFANFGIALSIILVLIILTGLFVSPGSRKNWIKTTSGVSLVAVVIVVIASINEFSWFGSYWWQNNWITLLWIAIIGFVISLFFAKPTTDETSNNGGPLISLRDVFGDRTARD